MSGFAFWLNPTYKLAAERHFLVPTPPARRVGAQAVELQSRVRLRSAQKASLLTAPLFSSFPRRALLAPRRGGNGCFCRPAASSASKCCRLASGMNRKWLAIDWVEDYLEGSKFRFGSRCIVDQNCAPTLASKMVKEVERIQENISANST